MPITVTNSTKKPVRSGGIDLKAGKNEFADGKLTSSQVAQMQAHPALEVDVKPAQEPKS